MKKYLIVLAISFNAQAAEQVITSTGSYLIQSTGSTTYVTQTAGSSTNTSSNIGVAVPVNVNPVTGIGMIQGPNGASAVIRSGSTTTVVPLSGGRR